MMRVWSSARSSTRRLSSDLARSARDLIRCLSAACWSSAAGLAAVLRQVALGRLHRAGGADQVLLERDPGIAQPGRGRRQRIRRIAVAVLVALELLELGRRDLLLVGREPPGHRIERLLERLERPPFGGEGRVAVPGRQVGHRVFQVRVGLLEVLRLEARRSGDRRRASPPSCGWRPRGRAPPAVPLSSHHPPPSSPRPSCRRSRPSGRAPAPRGRPCGRAASPARPGPRRPCATTTARASLH